MGKFEKDAVIKYLLLKGMSGKAIHDDVLFCSVLFLWAGVQPTLTHTLRPFINRPLR